MSASTVAVGGGARFEPGLARRKLSGTIFLGLCLLAIVILLLALLLLLFDVLREGLPWIDWAFLTGVPSRRPQAAGILPALVGSIEIIDRWRGGLSDRRRRGGLPPGVRQGQLRQPTAANQHLQSGRRPVHHLRDPWSYLLFARACLDLTTGALTLVLLILPVIILASIEALRAVPDSQREGAYALGASRWQMVRGTVLPAATPGILTGIILAMARAIGEAAPLVLIGAVGFVTFVPQPWTRYTVLPIQIYQWAGLPQADFQGLAAATIIVILVVMLLLNALALVVRARLSRNIQW